MARLYGALRDGINFVDIATIISVLSARSDSSSRPAGSCQHYQRFSGGHSKNEGFGDESISTGVVAQYCNALAYVPFLRARGRV
jgi:hypothetical protein